MSLANSTVYPCKAYSLSALLLLVRLFENGLLLLSASLLLLDDSRQAYIDMAFSTLDENGDGFISLEELMHVSGSKQASHQQGLCLLFIPV